MPNKKFRVSLVLDETGSMFDLRHLTISGVNEYIDTLRKADNAADIRFTLITFSSHRTVTVWDNKKLKNVASLTEEIYVPNGMTPLYDAIASAIKAVENEANPDDDVLVVIQTDGKENFSKEYDFNTIVDLISRKKSAGWTFAFLGADIDSFAVAGSLGISKGNTMSYEGQDTFSTFAYVANATSLHLQRGGGQTESFYDVSNEANAEVK